MRIKIISDGTPRGTRVVNAATGEDLVGVYAVSWQQDVHGSARATIKVVGAAIEAETTINEKESS